MTRTLAALRPSLRVLVGAAALAVLGACHSAVEPRRRPKLPKITGRDASAAPALPLELIAGAVPADSFGPHRARMGDHACVAWAAKDGDGYRLRYRSLIGTTVRKEVEDGPRLPDGLSLFRVVAFGRPADPRFGMMSVVRRATGDDELRLLVIDGQGEPRSGIPGLLSRGGHIVWADAVETGRDVVFLWANQQGSRATVIGRRLSAAQELGPEVTLATGVQGWQAVGTDGGLRLATVNTSGQVALHRFDPALGARRSRVLAEHALPELDAITTDRGLLVAWTAKAGGSSTVRSVLVEGATPGGEATEAPSPRRVVAAIDGYRLVRLVPPAGAGSGHVIVEEVHGRRGDGRSLRLLPLDPDGVARGDRLAFHAVTNPEAAPLPDGGAVLLITSPCPPKAAGCDGGVPHFLRVDRSLALTAAQPVTVVSPATKQALEAPLAWDLDCHGKRCRVLAAEPRTPTPVHHVALRPTGKLAEVARVLPAQGFPRPVALRPFDAGEPIADASLARLSQGTLYATLSDFDPTLPYERPPRPAPDGRFAPVRSQLRVRVLARQADGTVQPQGKLSTLSLRARRTGGVALAAAPGGTSALVGWAAIDGGKPQVFLTRVGPAGTRIGQRMVTKTKAEKHAVAVAGTDAGWLAAWVEADGMAPSGSLRVAAFSERLVPRAGGTSVAGSAAGTVGSPQLLPVGKLVLLAYVSSRKGESNILLAPLDPKTGEMSARAAAVAPRKGALAHDPVLVDDGAGGAVLGFLAGDQVVMVPIAAGGTPGTPHRFTLGGRGERFALECSQERCRGAVVVKDGAGPVLRGFVLPRRGGGKVTVEHLMRLPAPATVPLPVVLSGASALVATRPQGPDSGAIRHLVLRYR